MTRKVASFEWVIDPTALGKAIERDYADRIVERGRRRMREAAPEAEGLMKRGAPWQDRTGEARRLLMAETVERPDESTLYLIHGSAYGIWLELRHAGRYAVIAPTVHQMAARLRGRLEGLV